jgi:O-acetylhomoserine (thiol)-lyase
LSSEQLAAAGITEGLLRISVGLEDEADLLADFAAALEAANAAAPDSTAGVVTTAARVR